MAVTVSAVQHAKKSIWRPLRLLRAGVLTLANATRWGIAAAFGTAWLVTVDIESGVRWPHAAASGRSCGVTEIDRPSTIATAKKTAMVPLETGQPDQSPVESENGTPIENFLIIDVTLLSEDRMHPYALDITSDGSSPNCPSSAGRGFATRSPEGLAVFSPTKPLQRKH